MKRCPDCDQSMLPPGQVKRPNEYDHARGCPRGRVTTSQARALDRATILLQKGRISYGRWVETLDAWARGQDVSRFDYGDAESLPDRVARLYAGRAPVTAAGIAADLGVEPMSASVALGRLCRRRLARRVGHGCYDLAPYRAGQFTRPAQ